MRSARPGSALSLVGITSFFDAPHMVVFLRLAISSHLTRSAAQPDGFPLRPGAGLGRFAPRDDLARSRQQLESIARELEQLLGGVEVDAQPGLGPFLVTRGEPAESIPLD